MGNSHILVLDCQFQCYYQGNLASNVIDTHLYMCSIIPMICVIPDTTITKILVCLLRYKAQGISRRSKGLVGVDDQKSHRFV